MRILLLAGGGGTRLWPLSTEERPKQFLPLLSEKSLLKETYDRLRPMTRDIFVATSARHVALVRRELGRSFPPDHVLSESSRRNSGPALLSAALRFVRDGDPMTAAVPSDQTVADDEAFRRALAAAASVAEKASVAVLAVRPTRPETDFGYLEVRDSSAGEGLEVLRFVEKPSPEEAEKYVRSGFYWNAGIFVFRPSRLLAAARRVAGELVSSVEEFQDRLSRGDGVGAAAAYDALPNVSIDYAVMERAENVRAVPLRAGWSDMGTWRSVRETRGASDDRGNLIVSEVPVLAPGVRESAIVAGPEGILVLPFEREGELKAAVERLRREDPGREKG